MGAEDGFCRSSCSLTLSVRRNLRSTSIGPADGGCADTAVGEGAIIGRSVGGVDVKKRVHSDERRTKAEVGVDEEGVEDGKAGHGANKREAAVEGWGWQTVSSGDGGARRGSGKDSEEKAMGVNGGVAANGRAGAGGGAIGLAIARNRCMLGQGVCGCDSTQRNEGCGRRH